MKVPIQKYGELLISRPAGHEAFLVLRAYARPQTSDETIELDFTGVKVLTPSWADEVLTGLRSEFQNPIVCLPSENSTVLETLRFLGVWPEE